MDEKSLLTWFEQINGRVSEVVYPTRPENHSAWTGLFTEMQTALESVFPPSHTVLRKWEEAMSCESQAVQISPELHDRDLILQLQDDLLEIFRTAHRLLNEGHARSLADGIRAETITQCLDQAKTLANSGYVVAAIVLAGGALETHLYNLCGRFSLSWAGEGSISKYNQALGQARNQGTQSLVTASDSNLIESWGKDRNEAAHSPTAFTKTAPEVRLAIEGIRQFLARTQ